MTAHVYDLSLDILRLDDGNSIPIEDTMIKNVMVIANSCCFAKVWWKYRNKFSETPGYKIKKKVMKEAVKTL